jgi:putative FmdB family regulatory protein
MPTYEYRCPDGHTFERFFRTISGAESEVACPECGKPAARMMSAGAGLLFKGSGFYLTDYGKNAHRGGEAPADKAKKSDESSSGGETKSTETKPAAESKPETSSKSTKSEASAPAAPSSPSPKSDT